MKPVPQAEIVIIVDVDIRRLRIYTHSADAYSFVQQHAPEYGTYWKPNEVNDFHWLYVKHGYDMNEIAEYLKTM